MPKEQVLSSDVMRVCVLGVDPFTCFHPGSGIVEVSLDDLIVSHPRVPCLACPRILVLNYVSPLKHPTPRGVRLSSARLGDDEMHVRMHAY